MNDCTLTQYAVLSFNIICMQNVQLRVLLMLQSKTDRLSEQRKFGIYYDDDYDYLQHLRDVSELNDVGIVERFHISADEVVNIKNQK